jgi:SAM-dependent methyltransferase
MQAKFEQLLNAYWLRPETALWRALDIRAVDGFQFESPSIDIGCGDGLFSFIRAGGTMGPDFDAFKFLTNLDKFFDNVDIYDAFQKPLTSYEVLTKPLYSIDIGFDHKESLLNKASILNLYKETILGDASVKLPFENEKYKSIFSNIVYWLDEPFSVISEISRILHPQGKVCLLLPNETLPDYSFYNQLYIENGNPKWAFLEKIDRGRFSNNIQQAKSKSEWENIFSQAGLKVVNHKNYLSKTTVQVWDIGLRPLFPVLKLMTDSIKPQEILLIKKQWIDTIRMFLEPLIEVDTEVVDGQEPAFHCYILEK